MQEDRRRGHDIGKKTGGQRPRPTPGGEGRLPMQMEMGNEGKWARWQASRAGLSKVQGAHEESHAVLRQRTRRRRRGDPGALTKRRRQRLVGALTYWFKQRTKEDPELFVVALRGIECWHNFSAKSFPADLVCYSRSTTTASSRHCWNESSWSPGISHPRAPLPTSRLPKKFLTLKANYLLILCDDSLVLCHPCMFPPET